MEIICKLAKSTNLKMRGINKRKTNITDVKSIFI